MKQQFFIFGRGERGSQQRLFLQFEVFGAFCRFHVFTVNVAQVASQEKVVFRVGTAKMAGKRRFYVHSDFKSLVECSLRGVTQFRETRVVNKLHKLRRAGKSVEAQRQKYYKLKGYL